MNIFEELAESYTYNGVVSLKALDDDIVTLENQIDSYNATLKELQVRGKKVGPLVGKIRDAKIRLSLLKAVYKRESDKATPDDVILNMLGVSAKNAKEVDGVSTAADGKKPKPQNFESAELEEVVEDQDNAEVKAPETDNIVDNEAVTIHRESDAEMQANVLRDSAIDNEVTVLDKNATVDENSEVCSDVVAEVELNEVEVKTTKTEPVCKECELKNIAAAKMPAEKEVKNVKAEKINLDEPTIETVPFPTIDDYCEIESGPSNNQELFEPQQVFCDDATTYPGTPGEVVLNEAEEENNDPKVYDPFEHFDNKIYVSFDLSNYTDMVNSDSVTGQFDDRNKTLELTFTDMIDYPLLSFFLNEKHKKQFLFDRFAKKQKNIIMYVRTEINGVKKEYRYEFIGCRLDEVFDSGYKSMRESTYYPTATHEFYAKFKYKRFKIS